MTSYDAGRDGLVDDIKSAAAAKGWTVTVRYENNKTDTTPDANGVGNDGRVAVITITKQPADQA